MSLVFDAIDRYHFIHTLELMHVKPGFIFVIVFSRTYERLAVLNSITANAFVTEKYTFLSKIRNDYPVTLILA